MTIAIDLDPQHVSELVRVTLEERVRLRQLARSVAPEECDCQTPLPYIANTRLVKRKQAPPTAPAQSATRRPPYGIELPQLLVEVEVAINLLGRGRNASLAASMRRRVDRIRAEMNQQRLSGGAPG